jgi:hypothetical protein
MFLTIVVPNDYVDALRGDCDALGPACANMFTCQVTDTVGVFYIASGFVPDALVDYLPGVIEQYGLDVSTEQPLDAMERLQLSFM